MGRPKKDASAVLQTSMLTDENTSSHENPPGNAATPSKQEMVNEAVAEGVVKTSEIGAWIQAKYGVELSEGTLNGYSAKARSAAGLTRSRSSSAGSSNHGAEPATPGGGVSMVGAIKSLNALRQLIDSMGSDKAKVLLESLKPIAALSQKELEEVFRGLES
jgi:hypothetical protein